MRKDGSYVGRSAPEIDVLEATIIDHVGFVCHVSILFNGPILTVSRCLCRLNSLPSTFVCSVLLVSLSDHFGRLPTLGIKARL